MFAWESWVLGRYPYRFESLRRTVATYLSLEATIVNPKSTLKCVAMNRDPAVCGTFYQKNTDVLRRDVKRFIADAAVGSEVSNALSYVAPHAGYKYSGAVAGFTYKALGMNRALKEIETFIIIGPNHTGLGYPVSISGADWNMPFGTVENDLELSGEIASHDGMAMDEDAHGMEHSIEVQLPFLQEVVKKPKCCFICMGDQSMDYCRMLKSAISESAKHVGRRIMVIASSDMNHYEPADEARRKDLAALDEIAALRPEKFHEAIIKSGDSACGFGPITVSAMFAKDNGAKSGKILKYANSGDVTGDYESVVAYPSIAFV